MSEVPFQHVRAIGEKFEGSSVVLDNMWFENCSFENCDVFYSGGPSETRTRMRGCKPTTSSGRLQRDHDLGKFEVEPGPNKRAHS